jgi:hypothetical protein
MRKRARDNRKHKCNPTILSGPVLGVAQGMTKICSCVLSRWATGSYNWIGKGKGEEAIFIRRRGVGRPFYVKEASIARSVWRSGVKVEKS